MCLWLGGYTAYFGQKPSVSIAILRQIRLPCLLDMKYDTTEAVWKLSYIFFFSRFTLEYVTTVPQWVEFFVNENVTRA